VNGANPAWWLIPITALILSVGGLIFTILGLRVKATRDYVEQLERQLTNSQEDLEKCQDHTAQLERERNELRSDNYELLRRMIGMPAKP